MSGGVTYYTGTTMEVNTPGTTGQVLVSQGSSAPVFQNLSPTATAFFAYLSSSVSGFTGDGSTAIAIFDTAPRNDSSIYNTSTGVFTPNQTGMWCLTYGMTFTGLTALQTQAEIWIYDFATSFQMANWAGNLYPIYQPLSPNYVTVFSSISVPLTSGDTLSVAANIGTDSPTISLVGSGGNYFTYFSGFFVG